MANYSSNLKTWGDVGSEYPTGYSYLEGEQPVDAWDNFTNFEAIKDILHLVQLTNARLESETRTSWPSSPEGGHIVRRTDGPITGSQELHWYNDNLGQWHRVMKADGDTMSGALNMGGYSINGVQNVYDNSGNLLYNGSLIQSERVESTGLDADTVDGLHAGDIGLPGGVIVMWSGLLADIPSGWALCDGTNGTPDLTDRFVKGVPDSSTEPGTIGGTREHDHTLTDDTSTYYDINSSSGTFIHYKTDKELHLPPFYEVAFIMKL